MDRILKSILSETPRGREYLAAHTKAKRDASARRRSRSPRASAKPAPEESHSERTRRVRREVWERALDAVDMVAVALCECGCGRPIHWDTFEMDHWIGASKRAEMTTAENCWALARCCHQDKGGPDVEHWNVKREAFCKRYGLPFVPRKPTRYYASTP